MLASSHGSIHTGYCIQSSVVRGVKWLAQGHLPSQRQSQDYTKGVKAKAFVLTASQGLQKAWECTNHSLSPSITVARALLCFPRSQWRRKEAGTSPWQRSSSGQAGKGEHKIWGEVWPGTYLYGKGSPSFPPCRWPGEGRIYSMLGTARRRYLPAVSSSRPQTRWHLPGAGH